MQVGVPKVKVRVENKSVGGEANSILLDPIDFLRGFSVLKDELVSVRVTIRTSETKNNPYMCSM